MQVTAVARWRWLLSAALAASAISAVATVEAQEADENGGAVSIDEIPAPARAAIQREVGTGWLMGVYEETWHGQPAYRGRIYKGSRNLSIWVDAEGNILERHLVAMK
jgi:hypothetical protein